jgi:hypothetical protein
MKRISTILVVLVMMTMCTSSFGFFLVYNVSTSVKGADGATDDKTTVPLKGYLLLNLDNTSGEVVDANLVLYGKDSNTPTKQKVYVQLNDSDANSFLGASVWYVADFVFVNIWSYEDPFDFEMLLSGKIKLKDVGKGTSDMEWVASSIKGVNMVWDGFLLGPSGQNVSGTANASATLNSLTKSFNDTLPSWTQDQIINGQLIDGVNRGIIPDLERKGYINATPLVP